MTKRNKDYKKAFNSLNGKLGDNALEDKIDDAYNEQQELTSLIESITRDISIAEVELKEQQKALETIKIETTKQKKDNQELEPPILMPTELIFGQSEVSDEKQYDRTQESGPTLVKRKKTANPNDSKN